MIGAHMVDSAANIVYIGARSWTAWHQEMDAVIEIVEGRQE